MQKHGSICFAPKPLPNPTDPGDGVNGQNSTFPEHGHVAYQIKENQVCSNLVPNILPAEPPPPSALCLNRQTMPTSQFKQESLRKVSFIYYLDQKIRHLAPLNSLHRHIKHWL